MAPHEMLYNVKGDKEFQHPYVDIDEWRDLPVRHRYIHGGFKETNVRFSFYFPPAEGYERRFFQFLAPVQGSENAAQLNAGADSKIGFALSSGAYFVESNMGGMGSNSTMVFRSSASVAQYSRDVASGIYGPHRPYGYLYGGSGGGFKTISCMENTAGVWDGAVPYVIGSPMAIPNVFMARVHASRILKKKIPAIIDALEPGGSGDMYMGLDEEERQALKEVTQMGFPPKTWWAHEYIGNGSLSVLSPSVFNVDPGYFDDFWKVPGYLGADPNSSASRARMQHITKVTEVIMPKQPEHEGERSYGVDDAWQSLTTFVKTPSLVLETVPDKEQYFDGAYLIFLSGEAEGLRLPLGKFEGNVATIGSMFGSNESSRHLDKIKPGDELIIDNSDYIALQTYYRHQVPTNDYYVWDQFRDVNGQPIYPQRQVLLGPRMAKSGAGSIQCGRFHGKMIVVEALMDESAFPWQADWYRSKVREALGEQLEDNFRLWYIEHALHNDSTNLFDELHEVGYLGALHQAIRDLSTWVEQGISPPESTQYEIVDGQVIVPQEAETRKGIQPVLHLTVNGEKCAVVSVEEPVSFSGDIELPAHTGRIVSARMDFEGEATFPVEAIFDSISGDGSRAVISAAYSFNKPGIYFPVLRVAANREGNADDIYTQVLNIDRVRVIVN